jgi:adenosylmethionine-8-amino-7-oxononanoate aminotransferase
MASARGLSQVREPGDQTGWGAEELSRRYIWPLFPKDQIATDGPVVLAEGDGSMVTDVHGKTYLDLSSGISRASSLGAGNSRMIEAVQRQMEKLHYAGQGEFQADIVFELAAKLAELTPGDLGASYFTESGTGANEAAIKLARLFHRSIGRKPRAYKVISRWTGYHGAVGTPMAASDWLGVRLPSEPGAPGVSFVPVPTRYRSQFRRSGLQDTAVYLDLLEQQIVREGPELVAAVIAEPVMQAGGVQIPPADYFAGVREICDSYDVLFIADEVITGFGRTGKWFGIEHWGVQPDLMTMAKSMTAGYSPLGAVTAREDIWAAIAVFPEVHTFGGHPVAAAAALAAIEIYTQHGLVERARDAGEHLLRAAERLEQHQIVGEVRGLGLWVAVDFCDDKATGSPLDPEVVRRVLLRARALGLILTQNGSALEFAPRLDVPIAELDTGVGILEQAITEVPRV